MPPELRFSASSAERRPPATRTSNATVGRIGLEIRRDSAERHQYQSQRPQCCWHWLPGMGVGGGVLGSLAPRLEELDRISGVPGFGEPGDERPVHFGTAPDRDIIDKPLGDKELISIRFPDELPDGGVTARVFLEALPEERQEEPR